MHNSRATLRYARQRQQVLADEPPLVKMFLARQRRAVLAGLQAAQTRDLATAPAAAARPGIAAMLAASPAEAWQHGTAGMYDHRHAVALPWGFTPAEVGLPTGIWHGTANSEISPGMAEHLAQVMPRASLTMLPGEGHLLLFTHWADILRQLGAQQLATPELR